MIYRRGKVYYVEFSWRPWGRHKLSTATSNKVRAQDIERMLRRFRSEARHFIGLLVERKVQLPELYDAWTANPEALEAVRVRAESPKLGGLVEKWVEHCLSPAGISPRTKRRYTSRTVERYRVSWEGLFAVLPKGRDSTLPDLTRGFVIDYRRSRKRATGGRQRKNAPGKPLAGSTLNRDLAALGAFMTWARDVRGLVFERPKLPREREPAGNERWLTPDELRAFELHCAPEWWPFFAVLFYAGLRLSEAQGLRGGDVQLGTQRISINERHRRLKTASAVRDVPLDERLERALAGHLARVKPGQTELVFPGDFEEYGKVRRAWAATCKAADIKVATPHAARHTFGVNGAMGGVPIVRLQKLMGHATRQMTLRYMRHAPEAFITEDGKAIIDSVTGVDAEGEARADAARKGMRTA